MTISRQPLLDKTSSSDYHSLHHPLLSQCLFPFIHLLPDCSWGLGIWAPNVLPFGLPFHKWKNPSPRGEEVYPVHSTLSWTPSQALHSPSVMSHLWFYTWWGLRNGVSRQIKLTPISCTPPTCCLQGGRFHINISWESPSDSGRSVLTTSILQMRNYGSGACDSPRSSLQVCGKSV